MRKIACRSIASGTVNVKRVGAVCSRIITTMITGMLSRNSTYLAPTMRSTQISRGIRVELTSRF